jgi:hypothetical protein
MDRPINKGGGRSRFKVGSSSRSTESGTIRDGPTYYNLEEPKGHD